MLYGLIGEHLAHSYSKEIHSNIADYTYDLCEIPPERLESFIKAKDFKGINVTIPYKQKVMPYLDEISEEAEKIGAVNTVVNRDGRLYGYNTDFFGLSELIKKIGVDLKGKKVLILGDGGTAATARTVAESFGAGSIINVSRHPSGNAVSYLDAPKKHTDTAFIINTTPCGMYPNINATPICLDGFSGIEGVADAVYNPLMTRLVLSAREKGIKALGGLYMLSAQAVAASALFTGKEINHDGIEKAYNAVLKQKQNIVLIGMPSSGKSTLGKAVAKRIGMAFCDTDALIRERTKMPVPKFFERFGEDKFREVESEVIAELSALSGTVIATGGGAVLRQENVTALKQNGLVVFIDRPIEKLVPTADRPLSSDMTALKKRYDERYDLYCLAADITVENSGSVNTAAEKIIGEIQRENTRFKRP